MRMFALILLTLLALPLWAQDAPAKVNPQDLFAEGEKLFRDRKYDDARAKFELAATTAAEQGIAELQTQAEALTARMFALQTKWEDGRKWLDKAAKSAKPERKKGWATYLGVRGRFEWQDQKDNDKAKKTFIEMYDFCIKAEMQSMALDAAHMVALVGTPAEKEEWALKAIKAAEAANEKGWLGPLWNNLGWMYDEQGKTEKALEALQNARKYHHETGNEFTKMVADFGVAHALRRVGKLKEAREMLIAAFDKAKERYAADEKDKERAEWVGWGHKYFGDLLVDEGKKDEALKEYKAARPFLIQADIEKWGADDLKKIDDKIAELEKAYGKKAPEKPKD